MKWLGDLLFLFFPRVCSVCGTPLVGSEHDICISCLTHLPEALSARGESNFVEKRFMGRFPICHATSLLIFKHGNSTQHILHQIKYRGNERLAITMGRLLGQAIADSGLFADVDLLVPVPLHPRKERRRGYNQSLLLCKGICQTFPLPISQDNLVRTRHTKSQTRKNRNQRLENMKDVFTVKNPDAFKSKHILLIDDVITTGATTEACCLALLDATNVRLSIASLAVTGET